MYIDDSNNAPTKIYEFRPSTRLLADEIVSGQLHITDQFASAPLITIPENDASNDAMLCRLGDLDLRSKFDQEDIENEGGARQAYDIMTIKLVDTRLDRSYNQTGSDS